MQEWSGCVRDAIDRGQLVADTNVSGGRRHPYYRMLTTDLPLDVAAAHQAADAAWVAARYGVLGSAWSSASTASAPAVGSAVHR